MCSVPATPFFFGLFSTGSDHCQTEAPIPAHPLTVDDAAHSDAITLRNPRVGGFFFNFSRLVAVDAGL